MQQDFNDLAVIPPTQIIRAAGVSETFGHRRLRECVEAGLVRRPRRTPTGRTLLDQRDGRSFYEALIR